MPRNLLDEIFCQSLLEENKALHTANDVLQDKIEVLELKNKELEDSDYQLEITVSDKGLSIHTDAKHLESVMETLTKLSYNITKI